MTTNIHEQINESNAQATSEQQVKKSLHINPANYYDGKRFVPVWLATDLITNYLKVFVLADNMYWYQNGVYRTSGEKMFIRGATKLLVDRYKTSYVTEALNWVKSTCLIMNNRLVNSDDGLINVKNGLLDWRTGVLHPHLKDRLSTIQLSAIYDPDANDENVMNFIQNVVAADTIDTIFEIIGYCMTTNTRYEKAFLFKGTGGNGKSTFVNMLTEFLGQSNISNVSLQELESNKFKAAQLQGKLINTFADLPRYGLSNASNFKAIVSGDSLNVEQKFKDPFDFRPFVDNGCKILNING